MSCSDIKGLSSFRINRTEGDSGSFKWQPEYGAITFSERSLEDVVRYVRNQPERHRNQIDRCANGNLRKPGIPAAVHQFLAFGCFALVVQQSRQWTISTAEHAEYDKEPLLTQCSTEDASFGLNGRRRMPRRRERAAKLEQPVIANGFFLQFANRGLVLAAGARVEPPIGMHQKMVGLGLTFVVTSSARIACKGGITRFVEVSISADVGAQCRIGASAILSCSVSSYWTLQPMRKSPTPSGGR